MKGKQIKLDRYAEWENKLITLADYGQIVNTLNEDIGNTKVSPFCLHQLYLLASNSRKSNVPEMPVNVVTLNSVIVLSDKNNQRKKVKIVFPCDIKENNDISVYSSLGIACLGEKEKSYIHFKSGESENRFLIDEILYQPERELNLNS